MAVPLKAPVVSIYLDLYYVDVVKGTHVAQVRNVRQKDPAHEGVRVNVANRAGSSPCRRERSRGVIIMSLRMLVLSTRVLSTSVPLLCVLVSGCGTEQPKPTGELPKA